MEDNFINPVRGQGDSGEQQKTQTPLEALPLTGQTSNGVKITNAVYKILDFLPDNDPLKNRAKEKALAILENLTLTADAGGWVSLKTYLSADKLKASAQLLDDIEVLENYLKIGRGQGWIDNINFLIITNEYKKIKSKIKPPIGIIRKSIEINYKTLHDDRLANLDQKHISTNNKHIDAKNLEAEPKLLNDKKYSERQEKILEILSKKEKAQVSDFIKELPNITKRTVRRDLDDLLKNSMIVRVGEWNQIFYQKN